jgi:hypothetical protein
MVSSNLRLCVLVLCLFSWIGDSVDRANCFRSSSVWGGGVLRSTVVEVVRTEIRIEHHPSTKYYGDAVLFWDTCVNCYAYN